MGTPVSPPPQELHLIKIDKENNNLFPFSNLQTPRELIVHVVLLCNI